MGYECVLHSLKLDLFVRSMCQTLRILLLFGNLYYGIYKTGDSNFDDFTQWNIEYYEKWFNQHQVLKVFGRFTLI